MRRQILHIALAVLFTPLFAQQSNDGVWKAKFELANSFIENKGQYNPWNEKAGDEILFAIDNGPEQVYFTKEGNYLSLLRKV